MYSGFCFILRIIQNQIFYTNCLKTFFNRKQEPCQISVVRLFLQKTPSLMFDRAIILKYISFYVNFSCHLRRLFPSSLFPLFCLLIKSKSVSLYFTLNTSSLPSLSSSRAQIRQNKHVL